MVILNVMPSTCDVPKYIANYPGPMVQMLVKIDSQKFALADSIALSTANHVSKTALVCV